MYGNIKYNNTTTTLAKSMFHVITAADCKLGAAWLSAGWTYYSKLKMLGLYISANFSFDMLKLIFMFQFSVVDAET